MEIILLILIALSVLVAPLLVSIWNSMSEPIPLWEKIFGSIIFALASMSAAGIVGFFVFAALAQAQHMGERGLGFAVVYGFVFAVACAVIGQWLLWRRRKNAPPPPTQHPTS